MALLALLVFAGFMAFILAAQADRTTAIAGFIPRVVIMLYFVGAVNSGDGSAKPPAFVYAIVPMLFVFFNITPSTWFCNTRKSGRGRITCLENASISS